MKKRPIPLVSLPDLPSHHHRDWLLGSVDRHIEQLRALYAETHPDRGPHAKADIDKKARDSLAHAACLVDLLAGWAIAHVLEQKPEGARRAAAADVVDGLVPFNPDINELVQSLQDLDLGETRPYLKPLARAANGRFPAQAHKTAYILVLHVIGWAAFADITVSAAAEQLLQLEASASTSGRKIATKYGTFRKWTQYKYFNGAQGQVERAAMETAATSCRGIFPDAKHPDWFHENKLRLYRMLERADKIAGEPYTYFASVHPFSLTLRAWDSATTKIRKR